MNGSRLQWIVLTAGIASVAGCGTRQSDDPVSPVPQAVIALPASMELVAGSSAQMQAQVNDAKGAAIGGAPIIFRSSNPAVVRVSQSGLINAAGPIGHATISIASGVRVTQVPVRVHSSAAVALEWVQAPPSNAAAGTIIADMKVLARDEFGNPVAGAVLVWRLSDQGSSLDSKSETTAEDGTGAARWRAGTKVGSDSIDVRSGSLPTLVAHTNVKPGLPLTLEIRTEPLLAKGARVTAGAPVQLWAVVRDQYGNGVSNTDVAFRAIKECGVSATALVTDDAGMTALTDWVPVAAPKCELTATVSQPPIQASLPVTVTRGSRPKNRS